MRLYIAGHSHLHNPGTAAAGSLDSAEDSPAAQEGTAAEDSPAERERDTLEDTAAAAAIHLHTEFLEWWLVLSLSDKKMSLGPKGER